MLIQKRRSKDTLLECFSPPPLHIGWVEINNYLFYTGSNRNPEIRQGYGPRLITAKPSCPSDTDLESVFVNIPEHISIPLLSICLFSVIKYFFPFYPSRIDTKREGYAAVLEKKNHVVFYSLSGPQATELARAFVGLFTDYGEGNTKENHRLREQRVHDGTILVDTPQRDITRFVESTMLRDACVICTDATFPQNHHEVAMFTNCEFSQVTLDRVSDAMPRIVQAFVHWFEDKYFDAKIRCFYEASQSVFEEFKDLYMYNATRLHVADVAKDRLKHIETEFFSTIQFATSKKWEKTMFRLEYDYKQLVEFAKKNGNYYAQIISVQNWIETFHKDLRGIVSRNRPDYVKKLLSLQEASEKLGSIEPRYVNLFGTMRLFLKFLKENDYGCNGFDLGVLEQKVLLIFKSLIGRTEVTNPVTIIEEYLSNAITYGRVIPFRSEAMSNVCGWYDNKSNQIYLPYDDFFEDINRFFEAKGQCDILRYKKSKFIDVLLGKNILIGKPNGKKSTYIRPDTKVVISPTNASRKESKNVVRISLDCLTLSSDAIAKLTELASIKVPRRSKSLNEGSGQGRAPAE